jgi:hypothetical protein
MALLDDTERAIWERFHRDEQRALYLIAHAMVRIVPPTHLEIPRWS